MIATAITSQGWNPTDVLNGGFSNIGDDDG